MHTSTFNKKNQLAVIDQGASRQANEPGPCRLQKRRPATASTSRPSITARSSHSVLSADCAAVPNVQDVFPPGNQAQPPTDDDRNTARAPANYLSRHRQAGHRPWQRNSSGRGGACFLGTLNDEAAWLAALDGLRRRPSEVQPEDDEPEDELPRRPAPQAGQVHAAGSGTQVVSSPRKTDSDEDDFNDTLVLVDEKVVDGKLKSYGHEQELQADTDVAEPDHGKEVKASEGGTQTAELCWAAGRVGRRTRTGRICIHTCQC